MAETILHEIDIPMKLKVHLLFLICFFILLGAVRGQEPYNLTFYGNVKVYHVNADSAHAEEALQALKKTYEEIAYDLRIEETDTIKVIIAGSRREFHDLIQGKLPEWTGAFAVPGKNTMYVRSPRWHKTEENFKSSLIHEFVHLQVHQYVPNRKIPRWLDEGLAIFYSRENRWRTATAISKAITTNSLVPLDRIDTVLKFHRSKAELAYQESYSAVYYLLTTYDIDAVRIILKELRKGSSIDSCFIKATGSTFHQFEQEWLTYAKETHRGLWLSEPNWFWLIILLLLPIAYLAKKLHSNRVQEKWSQEQTEETESQDENSYVE